MDRGTFHVKRFQRGSKMFHVKHSSEAGFFRISSPYATGSLRISSPVRFGSLRIKLAGARDGSLQLPVRDESKGANLGAGQLEGPGVSASWPMLWTWRVLRRRSRAYLSARCS